VKRVLVQVGRKPGDCGDRVMQEEKRVVDNSREERKRTHRAPWEQRKNGCAGGVENPESPSGKQTIKDKKRVDEKM